MVWRNPDGSEMRVTFDSFDPEAGLLRYFDRNGRVEMFIEDLLDDVGNGELRLIRSGVDGAVNFEVPAASYPRFTQMLTRLRERYNASVLHGAEGQAAIVEFMRARGITNPAEFPRAIFLPGRAPDFSPRIILSEGARLHGATPLWPPTLLCVSPCRPCLFIWTKLMPAFTTAISMPCQAILKAWRTLRA
jgi:hypothetical protein